MTGFYIGVDGKARKIKGGYVGVDGKARKIKKGYIGDVNGVARLCYSDSPDPVFANNTWEDVIAACQNNVVPDTWSVGDQMTMNIGGTDYAVDIIGKNHDDYSDGSGKAPLTFQLHDCYETQYAMNNSNTNNGSWHSTIMCTTHLANIFELLPVIVQNNIKEVTKKTSKGSTQSTIVSSANKLFLLSEIEILGTRNGNSYAGEGVRYDYYVNGGSVIKNIKSTPVKWWTRSPTNGTGSFVAISSTGLIASTGASTSNAVSFAFCF